MANSKFYFSMHSCIQLHLSLSGLLGSAPFSNKIFTISIYFFASVYPNFTAIKRGVFQSWSLFFRNLFFYFSLNKPKTYFILSTSPLKIKKTNYLYRSNSSLFIFSFGFNKSFIFCPEDYYLFSTNSPFNWPFYS